jgi:hypothetical protein
MENRKLTIVSDKEYMLTKEEIDYLKQLFGAWNETEEKIVFTPDAFLTVAEMTEVLGCSKAAIYKRAKNKNNGCDLETRHGVKGVTFDNLVKNWM